MAPARMITSEQTVARIGRLMKVSTTTGSPYCRIAELQKGRTKGGNSASSWRSRGLRRRCSGFGCRRNRRAVDELLRAGDDHFLARFDSVRHRIVVADDGSDFDRALVRHQLPVGVLS